MNKGSELSLEAVLELVRGAKERLTEFDRRSLEICEGYRGYVKRFLDYLDEIEDEKQACQQIVDTYQSLIDAIVKHDMERIHQEAANENQEKKT